MPGTCIPELKLHYRKPTKMWWVVNDFQTKENPHGRYGPYATREEARDDLEGLLRFYREFWEEEDD